MDVIVVHASKHGSTVELAEAIAAGLEQRGHRATVADAEHAEPLTGRHAVVLGSAIYAGHWMKPAKAFVDRNVDALTDAPVWLFSSGPLGDPPVPDEDPLEVAALEQRVGALDHRRFSGKLDREELGLAERAVVRAVHAPYGDFRDWGAVGAWADEIADALDALDAEGANDGAATR